MATEKRLIDANALMETVEGVNWYHIDRMGYLANGANSQLHTPLFKAEDIFNAIRNAPTVDAVEVVCCEKCRYYEKAEYDEGYKMVCRLLKRQTASNGFCYCGERKDNDRQRTIA